MHIIVMDWFPTAGPVYLLIDMNLAKWCEIFIIYLHDRN
jgi:hypothetical protein